jgi:hypothetical protein
MTTARPKATWTADGHNELCDGHTCYVTCGCGRGAYPSCRYNSCYPCYLDRRADYVSCILCGRWHSWAFDTCFKCRPATAGRDDAARALRQLILHRDTYACRECGAGEGDEQYDPRADDHRPVVLQVDHIVPCRMGGHADEWNLQVLCALDNATKGALWHVGCRYETVRTELMRRYFWIAPTYFAPDDLARFRAEVAAWRATGTWDPTVQARWANATKAAR